MTYHGRIKNGTIVLNDSAVLPERQSTVGPRYNLDLRHPSQELG
jgi:hypothetical protein